MDLQLSQPVQREPCTTKKGPGSGGDSNIRPADIPVSHPFAQKKRERVGHPHPIIIIARLLSSEPWSR